MLLKTIIVFLFVAVVISLFSGLNFLVKDLGSPKNAYSTVWVYGLAWQFYC